ncbi:HTTM domain-containing protein [Streptomyces sp. NPDC059679]|uniref:HTTM domain-containing protein n=1 Tax=Streptomyces sp. NPDC059679 TaxID=3346903 RepID=UPI0036A52293
MHPETTERASALPAPSGPARVPGPAAPAAPPGNATAPPDTGLPGRPAALIAWAARVHVPHQAAVLRIGLAFVVAAGLLREWPHRRVLFGDRSPWSWDMAGSVLAENHAFSVLIWWDGRWWFELVYHATIIVAVLLMLGWHTRGTSVLFMVGVLSIHARNPFVMDGGDNAVHLLAIYLVFVRCGAVWSLDARRDRRYGPQARCRRAGVAMWQLLGLLLLWVYGTRVEAWSVFFWTLWGAQGLWYAANRWFPWHRTRALLNGATAMVHNCAMLVVAGQICLIYLTSSWYKIQGSRWQDGTAVYYALHLDYYRPWPWLSDLLSSNMLVVFLLTYGTVLAQASFPFTLLNRRAKNIMLVLLTLEHAGIGILIGIPFMSLTIIVCDAVFLPTSFLARVGDGCARATHKLRGSLTGAAKRPTRRKPVAAAD